MTDPAPLRIVMVQLPKESYKSERVLNGGNPDLYAVMVGLSRSVDDYERQELSEFGIVSVDDHMFARIENITLEQLRDQIDRYNAAFADAAERARVTREAAQAEDQRLARLAHELTLELRQAFLERQSPAQE